MTCLAGPHVRTVYRCLYCRGEVSDGLDLAKRRGRCGQCDRAVDLFKYREPRTRWGRLLLDAELLGFLAAVFVVPPALCVLMVVLMLRWGWGWVELGALGVGMLLGHLLCVGLVRLRHYARDRAAGIVDL